MLRLLLFLLIASSTMEGAYSRYNTQTDVSATVRELLVSFEDLKHEVRNHDSEIHTLEEKTSNFQEILDGVRKEQMEATQAMRESLKNLEAKISGHEGMAKGLTSSLQNHAADSIAALTDYKKRILELEKAIELQNRNIENLQTALKALLETSSKVATEDTGKIYRVKAGDSLDKIARAHQTSVKRIKELNGLTKDQIIVGQKLKLAEE